MFKNELARSLTNGGRFSSSSYTVNGSINSHRYSDLFVFEVHTALCNFTHKLLCLSLISIVALGVSHQNMHHVEVTELESKA